MRTLLLALAVFRLSLLLNREAGPGDIFVRLRLAAGMHFDEYGQEQPTGPLSDLLHCIWCLSVWVAALFALLHVLAPKVAYLCSLPLALSGATVLLNRYLEPSEWQGRQPKL